MFKRFFLFGFVNILIILTLSVILHLLGIGQFVTAAGMNYIGLFIFCLFWGMGGSLISLLISKWMAKMVMGVQLVTLEGPHRDLVATVHRLSRRAGLTTMPEVGIYQGVELNAFATGRSRNNALVAVSSGLLINMNQNELEGVLGHEVAHIANGDMITLALIQGVLNAFVMFFARVVAFMIDQQMRQNNRKGQGFGPLAYMLVVFVLQIIFGIFASIVINWFSRVREYKADEGGADLAGKDKMIAALECLSRNYQQMETIEVKPSARNFQAMQISSKDGFMFLFSSHPKLTDRINALIKK